MFLLSLFLAVTATARAQSCPKLTEAELRGLTLQARAAIDLDDPAVVHAILDDARKGLPCLDFAPDPRVLAQLYAANAILAFSEDEAWEPALTADFRLDPTIDLRLGSAHPLMSWLPSTEPETGTPAPAGVRLFVDGVPSSRVPPASGVHLVQRQDGRWWASLLLTDEAVPESWLATPARRRDGVDVQVGVDAWLLGWAQAPTDFESDWATGYEGALRFQARGGVAYRSGEHLGLGASVSHPLHDTVGFHPDASVQARWWSTKGWLGAGVTVVPIEILEGEARARTVLRVLPELSSQLPSRPNAKRTTTAALAIEPHVQRLQVRVERRPTESPVQWGAAFTWQHASLTEGPANARLVTWTNVGFAITAQTVGGR